MRTNNQIVFALSNMGGLFPIPVLICILHPPATSFGDAPRPPLGQSLELQRNSLLYMHLDYHPESRTCHILPLLSLQQKHCTALGDLELSAHPQLGTATGSK